MGCDFNDNPAALIGFTHDAQFVGGSQGFAVNPAQALFAQQAFDQRRPQGRADGVGALNAQHRALSGCRQIAGSRQVWQAEAQHQQEQYAQHHAGTLYSQGRCREIKSVRFPKNDTFPMWERACSRRGRISRHHC
ncbi:hypothetical protein D3C73_853440 [compost metagenome]